jgi:hypothetical protein
MTGEALARLIHETYEERRSGPPTSWDDTPKEHRDLMIGACDYALTKIFPAPTFGHTYDANRQCTKCMSFEHEPGGGATDPCPLD